MKNAVHRPFAAFRCVECDHIFASHLPAIHLDLPRCPICSGGTQVDGILVYAYRREIVPAR